MRINVADHPELTDLYDDIAAAYKNVDPKVGKLISDVVADIDDKTVSEKHKKLETIKLKANDLQKKLKEKVKPIKKKK
jgi:hypothetical protein